MPHKEFVNAVYLTFKLFCVKDGDSGIYDGATFTGTAERCGTDYFTLELVCNNEGDSDYYDAPTPTGDTECGQATPRRQPLRRRCERIWRIAARNADCKAIGRHAVHDDTGAMDVGRSLRSRCVRP